jgi:hypothetical protein
MRSGGMKIIPGNFGNQMFYKGSDSEAFSAHTPALLFCSRIFCVNCKKCGQKIMIRMSVEI